MIDNAVPNAVLSIVFAVLGFVLLYVGWRVFDALTPANIGNRIFEEGSVSAAVFAGAFIIGLAIVVAAAIS